MSPADQDEIDVRIQTYYEHVFDETTRLTTRSSQGPLEFHRTQELILEHTPLGRVVDIGGGSGIHAKALEDHGYEVAVVDPVRRHVDAARDAGLSAHAAMVIARAASSTPGIQDQSAHLIAVARRPDRP